MRDFEKELEESFNEFLKDYKIDKADLENEFVQQPYLVAKWGKQHAFSVLRKGKQKAKAERAKDTIKVTEGEVELDARISPEEYSLPKVTDNAINACVMASEKRTQSVLASQEEFNELAGCDALEVLLSHFMEALIDRRKALGTLQYIKYQLKDSDEASEKILDNLEKSVSRLKPKMM